jgi:DNA-binding transcriptional LysR family regulator
MDSKRRRPRLSLDLLKGFEAAARHLSFTRAAQELSLTQSAVSREIKTLEEQLGQPLFSRVNRGLRLTDAGQALYRAVGAALKLIDDATDHLAVTHGGEMLAITTSAALASMWLVPKLPRFIHPALARDRKRPLGSPVDLARHVLLDLEFATSSGQWSDWGPWLEAMKLGDLRPGGTLRFSHYDQVVRAVIDGSGVAIGRKPHNVRDLRDGLLVAPFGREAVLKRGTYFTLIPPSSAERRVVKAFVAWLRDEVRQDENLGSE